MDMLSTVRNVHKRLRIGQYCDKWIVVMIHEIAFCMHQHQQAILTGLMRYTFFDQMCFTWHVGFQVSKSNGRIKRKPYCAWLPVKWVKVVSRYVKSQTLAVPHTRVDFIARVHGRAMRFPQWRGNVNVAQCKLTDQWHGFVYTTLHGSSSIYAPTLHISTVLAAPEYLKLLDGK